MQRCMIVCAYTARWCVWHSTVFKTGCPRTIYANTYVNFLIPIAGSHLLPPRRRTGCSIGLGRGRSYLVAASIEIARRAYKKFEKGWFYPKFNVEKLDEQWKQTLAGVKTWKDLPLKIKELKLKYRFLLRDYVQNAVFSKSYIQKRYSVYVFT